MCRLPYEPTLCCLEIKQFYVSKEVNIMTNTLKNRELLPISEEEMDLAFGGIHKTTPGCKCPHRKGNTLYQTIQCCYYDCPGLNGLTAFISTSN